MYLLTRYSMYNTGKIYTSLTLSLPFYWTGFSVSIFLLFGLKFGSRPTEFRRQREWFIINKTCQMVVFCNRTGPNLFEKFPVNIMTRSKYIM